MTTHAILHSDSNGHHSNIPEIHFSLQHHSARSARPRLLQATGRGGVLVLLFDVDWGTRRTLVIRAETVAPGGKDGKAVTRPGRAQ